MGNRRTAIYARISRDKQGGGLGVDRQLEDCTALAERLGWDVVEVFTDNDLSAYSGKRRPGYRAMLAALEEGRADAVIAWHTDRLHRRPVELEEYVDLGERRGVITQTVTAGTVDLSTASGRMVARMLGAAARHEVEHAVERMRRQKAQAAATGRYAGGPRPFGYEKDGVTVREREAELIRAGTAELLAGDSLNAVTERWNASGVRSPRNGGRWSTTSVRTILCRPRNAGLMQHRGKVVGAAEWPALVPADDWRALCTLLKDPGRRTSPAAGRRWLLSGIARCGVCGEPVIAGTSASGNGGHHAGYRCRTRGHVTRRIDAVEAYVSAIVVARLSQPDAAAAFAPADDLSREDEQQLAELRTRLDDLAAMFARGEVDAGQLTTASTMLRAQVTEVEQRLAARVRGSVLAGVVGVDDVEAAWNDLPLGRRRAIVDTLVDVRLLPARRGRIPGWKPGMPYFDPASVEVTWKEAAA